MKHIFFTSLVFLFTSITWAQDFYCDIVYNNQVVLQNKVTVTEKNQKVTIGQSSVASAYISVSEKNLYTVEAFLPEYEVRIYGQGGLNTTSDTVTASLWGRKSMIDVNCRMVK